MSSQCYVTSVEYKQNERDANHFFPKQVQLTVQQVQQVQLSHVFTNCQYRQN